MKICILGSHPATRAKAPFDDPSWQIWACSAHNCPPHFTLPRLDRFYEVHVPAADRTRGPDYLDYVRKMSEDTPVYMRDRSGHPAALEYPMQEMVSKFGPYFLETSSIALMLAHAIVFLDDKRKPDDHEPPTIGIWGVMQSTASEYTYQLPGIQFFLTMAVMAGIDITVPEESQILGVRRLPF